MMSLRMATSMAASSPSKPAASMPHMDAVVPQKRASPVTGSALYSSPRETLPGATPQK